ncbi:MAG: ester cyclase [Chloroflexota bacterium]|nr:ester cyclase [Chloroflexota bacterium]
MSIEQNKAVSRRWFHDGYGQGDARAMQELATGTWLEDASIVAQIEAFHAAFPDLAVTVDEQIAEGDRVMTRSTWTGTHTGPLFGIEPTAKPFSQSLVEIHTITGGRIVDRWNDFSPVSIPVQLDVIKPPE